MSVEHETIVYTVPHGREQPDGSSVAGDMVVGVPDGEETLWAPGEGFIYLPRYEQDAVNQTKISLPPVMASRLPEFFRRYIMENAGGRSRPVYDCHFFAQYLLGSPHHHNNQRMSMTSYLAAEMIANGTRTSDERLEAGQLGVFGFVPDAPEGPVFPKHSVIGLGREEDRCIQVIGTYRPLMITGCGVAGGYYRVPSEVGADGNPPDPKLKMQATFTGEYGLFLPDHDVTPVPQSPDSPLISA